ncbi:T9SS type A sorting domain-containing protein [Fulvivirga lutimaris]|uniref:T9SS type A sorting domain-containing protein n=1 Tax=Fulvivirga lutimaris TaxID=1819566 RepID=UPI0012BCC770|nr:T9SS type A sorting domain-containing protein [Fulvivirga lutimaris]MTI41990.1 T9SS type A sorting domain-containing protein [Fulvivirga lutimaris]
MKKSAFKLIMGAVFSAVLIMMSLLQFNDTRKDNFVAKSKSKTHKKSIVVNGRTYDGPEKYAYYQAAIRAGQEDLDAPFKHPQYKFDYKNQELLKAKKGKRFSSRTESTPTFKERGPVNVPGRTRAIIVDPDDNSSQTWFAAGVSGGIWKTTDGGISWLEIAPEIENLQVVSLAMSASNSSVMYAGTGESFGGGAPFGQNGNGIYKSEDKGVTWSLLASTVNNDFGNVSRIIVDPTNENTLLASTAGKRSLGFDFGDGAIMRSTDGGVSWNKVFQSAGRPVQQVIAAPSDFNIQYASVLAEGVVKSIDAGLTWTEVSTGLSLSNRLELAISHTNPNKVYGSAVGTRSGAGADLYLTEDGGAIWNLVEVIFDDAPIDFLVQGSYDNCILVNPFNDDNVYFGGVSLFSLTRNPSLDGETTTFYGLEADEVKDFVSFSNFSNVSDAGGRLDVKPAEAEDKTVEIRFGPGISQMAHRFTIPTGQGSGVEANNYSFQDYIEVPFEVWNVTDDVQLMVSFRDQQEDGEFNLIVENFDGDGTTQSREYLFVNNVPYSASTPDENIALNGGHEHKEMYTVFPTLTEGGVWNAAALPSSKVTISRFTSAILGGDLTVVTDARQTFNSNNLHIQGTTNGVHPDNHVMVPIITNQSESEFKILLGTDGGIYASDPGTAPGVSNGSWTWLGSGYNTSQFYGADKILGREQYMGGTQDNGTWLSSASEDASSTSVYNFFIGGDGFEVVAHYTDPLKFIGGSQNNGFVGTDDGGESFYNATNGLSEDGGPFVSRLSSSYQDTDVLFTVEETGVYKSIDFGRNWREIPISEKWGFWSGSDVEVSKADPRIVWAGGRMTEEGSLFVSVDGGESFEPVPNFANLGLCTGIYSHPTKDSTAFAVFSVANSPKIIRTNDLGQTWTDISGYSAGSTSNGFPDVATFALQAMPYDENTYWAGTEIGIFETTDAGANWSLLDEFPSVSIWDFKIKDGQVIIATFGRGIWTADIPELADFKAPEVPLAPVIASIGKSLTELAIELTIDLRSAYDSTQVFANDLYAGSIEENAAPESLEASLSVSVAGNYEIQAISYVSGVPYFSSVSAINVTENLEPIVSYYSDFENINNDVDFIKDGFTINIASGSGATRALNTDHPYPTAESLGVNEVNLTAQLVTPIIVAETDAFIRFDEIVLVEEGEAGTVFGDQEFWDYVIVEGSKDGNNWVPLLDGYDSDADEAWDGTSNTATKSLYRPREIDIKNTFESGDIIQLRFRLFSDFGANAWGWAIDNLRIQFDDDDIPTGILKEVDSDVLIYPVPANEQLTIGVNNTFKGLTTVQIVDLNGKVKWAKSVEMNNQATEFSIDVSAFAQGIYLVKIKDSSSSLVRRISIQ